MEEFKPVFLTDLSVPKIGAADMRVSQYYSTWEGVRNSADKIMSGCLLKVRVSTFQRSEGIERDRKKSMSTTESIYIYIYMY